MKASSHAEKKDETKQEQPYITEYLLLGPFPAKREKAVYICLPDTKNPNEMEITIAKRGAALVQIHGEWDRTRKIFKPVKYIHFRGFIIRGGGQFQQTAQIAVCGSGNVVEGCLIEENESCGISVSNRDGIKSSPTIVRNNWIVNPGNVGIGAQHTSEFLTPENQTFEAPGRGRIIIEYNYIKGANWLTASPFWAAGGMKLFRLTDCIVRYNTVENCPSQGIWLDFEHYNNRLEGNLIRNCLFFGIGIEASPGPNLVVNNIITGVRPIGPSSVWFREGILAWSTQRTWAINNTIDGKWDTTPAWLNQQGSGGISLGVNKKAKRGTKWEGHYAPDLMVNNLILGCKDEWNWIKKDKDDFVSNNVYEKDNGIYLMKRLYPEKIKEKVWIYIKKEVKIKNLIDRENDDYRIKEKEFLKSANKILPEFIKPHFKRYDFYGLLRFPEDDISGAIRRWNEKFEDTIVEIDFYDGRMIKKMF